MNKEISITMTKKQLDYIIYTMYVALETDCKLMNKLGNKKIEKIMLLYNALHTMSTNKL
jgi:hypothetical protein